MKEKLTFGEASRVQAELRQELQDLDKISPSSDRLKADLEALKQARWDGFQQPGSGHAKGGH